MKILLLVDIQRDFCPGGALAVSEGDQVVPVANRLMHADIFKYVIASKDWHPAKHSSFASAHPGSNVYDEVQLDVAGQKILQRLWPDHCVAGSEGAEFHKDLDQSKMDLVIIKGSSPELDSYSAFYDNLHLKQTELHNALLQICDLEGLRFTDLELFICGLATDYCVAATARDAIELGLKTSLVLDACRAVNVNPGDDLKVLRELAELGVRITSERELLCKERDRPIRDSHPGLSIRC